MKKAKVGIIIALVLVFLIIVGFVIGVFFYKYTRINNLLNLGQKYLQEEDYENALIAFDEVLKIDEKTARAYIGAADAYIGQGDYNLAETVLRKGLEMTDSEEIRRILEEELGVDTHLAISSGNGERDIVLVLDRSGSMDGDPMYATIDASKNFVSMILEQDANISVITYDSDAYIVSDFSSSKSDLFDAVENINIGGGTDIEAGLSEAWNMLKRRDADKKVIVLMSDGEPNDGKVDEELIEFANEIKKDDITIYTLGFFDGLGGNKAYAQGIMGRIANEACHYEVASTNDLSDFFGDIASQINGQKYIYIRLACPVDITVSHNGETLSSSENTRNLRTDFGTLTFEDIDENNYEYYDDYEDENMNTDDQIKIVRLKEGEDYEVNLKATARGRMDYTIGFMDDYGNYDDFRRFRNIKVSRGTEIDTIAGVSDSSILNIDEDGDGKTDLKLIAKRNGRGEEVKPIWPYIVIAVVSLIAILTLLIIIIVIKNNIKKKRIASICPMCNREYENNEAFCGRCGTPKPDWKKIRLR